MQLKRWPLLCKPHWESPQASARVSSPESVKLADPARRLQPLSHLSQETWHLTETSARGRTGYFISTTWFLPVCSHVLFQVTDVTPSFEGICVDIDDLFFAYFISQPLQAECPLAPVPGSVIRSKVDQICLQREEK